MIPQIDHFHYDVTHAKVSGSCSKDCAQGRSIAGTFKIIHESTCNAMASESADHITSFMCIVERTSSDISDKPAFTPLGGCFHGGRKILALGRSYKADLPSAICFLYSVYVQNVVLAPSARIFLVLGSS